MRHLRLQFDPEFAGELAARARNARFKRINLNRVSFRSDDRLQSVELVLSPPG
jgi:hypothetical protein